MLEAHLSPANRVLLLMHNLGVVRPETAQTEKAIAQAARLRVEETRRILTQHVEAGYVHRFSELSDTAFYLTARGILSVCASFT